MNNKTLFLVGVAGVILFVSTIVIGGLLIQDYSITRQYISETFAIDTEYGFYLVVFGYIPSGALITIFGVLAYRFFPPSKLIKIGFWGLALFYGIGTIVVSIFPCDTGCNREFIDPSISQIIHNLAALTIYIFTPLSIIITGIGLSKTSNYRSLSMVAIVLGSLSVLFVYLFITQFDSEYGGLNQRIIESLILTWIIVCALEIYKQKKMHFQML
jgi:hypothetical membrane protein